MLEILQFILSGFWVFVGACILLYLLLLLALKAALLAWSRFLRHLNIRKHGWPPAHCDADGSFKQGAK